MSAKQRDGLSVLGDLRQSGSLRALLPRPAIPPTAMLLNTAGGVTGGDTFHTAVEAQRGARLTVTTQAAERAYRAADGPAGEILNEINVQTGGSVLWLPQETILFDGCNLNRRLSVDLSQDAEVLIVEPLVFGRMAHGETLRAARFKDHVRLRRDGRVIYADGMHLTGDVAAQMQHQAYGHGAGALAILVLASPQAARWLAPLRTQIAQNSSVTAGVSLLKEDLLLMRFLAHDSHDMRKLLLPVLDALTDGTLPICWRL